MAGNMEKEEMKVNNIKFKEEIFPSSTLEETCNEEGTCTEEETCTVEDTCTVKETCTVEETCTVYIKEEDVKVEISEPNQGKILKYNINIKFPCI